MSASARVEPGSAARREVIPAERRELRHLPATDQAQPPAALQLADTHTPGGCGLALWQREEQHVVLATAERESERIFAHGGGQRAGVGGQRQ